MKYSAFLTFIMGLFLFSSCERYKTSTTESGLKYQIHSSTGSGKKAKYGDILTFELLVKGTNGQKDTVLKNSFLDGSPISMPLQKPRFGGSFEEGLSVLSKGDSATIFVPVDSLFREGMPLPPGIKKGTDLQFLVKVRDIKTTEDFEKEAREAAKNEQPKIDAFVAKNLPNAQSTASGLRYVIQTAGMGDLAKNGDVLVVHYTGKLLDGREFDSSKKQGRPYDFPLGQGQAIKGWEEAMRLMRKGSKATIVMPSNLAYGAQGAGEMVPPFSTLVFDIEIEDIKKR